MNTVEPDFVVFKKCLVEEFFISLCNLAGIG
jgi:hypothetical protein